MEKENVLSLLRKLIAQADGERAIGNLAAAEAFASRAQELLFKYKLEMSDVEFAAEEQNEPVLGEVIYGDDLTGKVYNYDRQRSDIWISTLMNACARANFCKLLKMRGGKNVMTIVGRASDRAAATALFSYLSKACIEIAPSEADASGECFDKFEKRTWVSSYKLGFANAIYNRLDRKMDMLKEGAPEQGLIRIDQIVKATEKKFKELFPSTVSTGGGRPSNGGGFRAGSAYGSSIGINSTKRLGGQVGNGGGISIFGR